MQRGFGLRSSGHHSDGVGHIQKPASLADARDASLLGEPIRAAPRKQAEGPFPAGARLPSRTHFRGNPLPRRLASAGRMRPVRAAPQKQAVGALSGPSDLSGATSESIRDARHPRLLGQRFKTLVMFRPLLGQLLE